MIHDIWGATFEDVGALSTPPIEPFLEAYTASERFYHNWRHLESCVAALQDIGELTPFIAVALFYHDLVYDTQRSDNEEQSAVLMAQQLREIHTPEHHIETIRRLILATQHQGLPLAKDEQWIVDADLSILGSAPEIYHEYVKSIRQEYAWVDDASFATGRGKFIKQMLNRQSIFSTDQCRSLWEKHARSNLQHELDGLR